MQDIAIVGLGSVGTAVAGALLTSGVPSSLTFFDAIADKAEGEALDFRHAGSLLPRCAITARPLAELGACDMAILTAGAKSRPGESRLALLERNVAAATGIAALFERNGLPRGLLVLSNPVDVITEFFVRRWRGRGVAVFGSGTALDSQRLREQIATRFGVGAASVHAWVVGEHGDSSVPLFSSASIGCLPLEEVARQRGVPFDAFVRETITTDVREAAMQVIRRKGATAHAIGHTAAALARAVARDERVVVPVSVPVRPGVCASLPCVIGAAGPGEPLWPVFSQHERASFEASLATLEDACRSLPVESPA